MMRRQYSAPGDECDLARRRPGRSDGRWTVAVNARVTCARRRAHDLDARVTASEPDARVTAFETDTRDTMFDPDAPDTAFGTDRASATTGGDAA